MAFGKHLKDSRRLIVLKRYQNRFMHKRTSVAEHVCSVAMISQWLGFIEKNIFKNEVDMSEIMQRAINFNVAQVWTGNLLASTRSMSEAMDEEVKSIKEITFNDFIKPSLPVSWIGDFKRFTIGAKDDSVEGKIIVAADLLDEILECIDEIKLNNKEGFEDILIESISALSKIDLNSVKYIIKYALPKFNLSFDFYGKDFLNTLDSIKFKDIDDLKLEEFSVVGDYIYKYRSLMSLKRYQNKFMFNRTSVAEHTWSVSKISQGLAIWTERKFGQKVDMASVLCRSIGHDFSEFITGDILSTTKRMTPKIKEAIDEIEIITYAEQLSILIPKTLRTDFKSYILDAKDDTIEGKILAASDVIDALCECAEEVKLGNIEVFGEVLRNVSKNLLNIKLEAADYFLKHSLRDLGLPLSSYGEEMEAYVNSL